MVIWIIYTGLSSRFPLADHPALPGSKSVFGLSPICACTSRSQDRCYRRGSVDITPFLTSKEPPIKINKFKLKKKKRLSAHIQLGRSPWPGEWEISGQDLAPPALHLAVSVHRRKTPAVQSDRAPSVSCLKSNLWGLILTCFYFSNSDSFLGFPSTPTWLKPDYFSSLSSATTVSKDCLLSSLACKDSLHDWYSF